MITDIFHALVLLGALSCAIIAVRAKDLLVAVVMLGAMSLLVAIEFYILQAPDVAITEAAVGAGLSTAIYLVAVEKTKRMEE
ncbi:MAG: hydrogenase subunit MbhD domain-containing protein, partial [Candidatus Diapherotrites archaeon]